MASEIYFQAQIAAQRARQANALAGQAHNMLIRIDAIRTAIATDERGALVDTLTRSWHGLVDARNLTIGQWQTLTGRQWECRGENVTRA
jgi:hypothetical protein